jgi:hypothetical protein
MCHHIDSQVLIVGNTNPSVIIEYCKQVVFIRNTMVVNMTKESNWFKYPNNDIMAQF